jgi:hypothetical protein
VGDGVATAVGVALGAGVDEAADDGVGDAAGVGVALGEALGAAVADGADDGVGFGVGPTPKFGATVPIRGRSCCVPENGARSFGDDTTSAATAPAATSEARPTGRTSTRFLKAGRSPVFCGERA